MNVSDTTERAARTDDVDGVDVRGDAAVEDKAVSVFGLPLTCTDSLNHAEELVAPHVTRRSPKPFLVTFANPLAVKLMRSDESYRANIRRMNLVFCDGIGLTWAARKIARYPLERISFDSASLAPSVFRLAEGFRRGIALVGSRPGVAEAAAEQIRTRFPGIRFAATIDGYRPTDRIAAAVLAVDPDIVVCGMGAPRQEAVLLALTEAGWRGAGFTCGGYLDQLVERFDFYPSIVNRLNLRWLYRIAREPRRLGYRYAVEYAPFFRAFAHDLVRRESRDAHWRRMRT